MWICTVLGALLMHVYCMYRTVHNVGTLQHTYGMGWLVSLTHQQSKELRLPDGDNLVVLCIALSDHDGRRLLAIKAACTNSQHRFTQKPPLVQSTINPPIKHPQTLCVQCWNIRTYAQVSPASVNKWRSSNTLDAGLCACTCQPYYMLSNIGIRCSYDSICCSWGASPCPSASPLSWRK